MNDDARPEAAEPAKPEYSEAGGVVQLRFADNEENLRDINAAEMAEAIQGLVEFTSEMAKSGMFGQEAPPELRVRPPKEGSFIVEAIVHFYTVAPEATVGGGLTAAAAVAQSIRVGVRRLRGEEPTDFDYLANGDVKIVWPGGKVDQVPSKVWEQLNISKRRTRKALSKIMAPLSDNDVDTLEVRDGSVHDSTAAILAREPDVVADMADYRVARQEEDEVQENSAVFDAEAQLRSIDFREGAKWRVKTLHGTRKAKIEDEEFLRRLDQGMALHKNDIFDVTVREVTTVKNGRTTRDWSLIRVVRKKRGEDDDNGPSSPQNPASPA